MSETDFEYGRVMGEKLRAARQQRHITLRDLAERAGTSASMLSQIETGKAYPSVRSIYNIAAALDLPVDHFFPERSGSGPVPVEAAMHDLNAADELTASEMREASLNQSANGSALDFASSTLAMMHLLHASARPTIVLKGGVTWSRLTAAAEPGVEFLEITYQCGASSGENLSRHEGREFGLILEGEMALQLGFEQVTLSEGDSIVFDSTTPHRLANKGTRPMRALWVVWNRA